MVKLKVTKPFTYDRDYTVGELIDINELSHFGKTMLTNRIMNGFLEYQQEPVLSALELADASAPATEEKTDKKGTGRSFRLPDETPAK